MQKTYDVIGDIHGFAPELKKLLTQLGYRETNEGWAHEDPNRQAVFVGDFIDRGPENFETLRIVRGMVDNGNAHAVMGNHDFNAVLFHTPRADGEGHLRAHTKRNIQQHAAFLQEYAQNPEDGKAWIQWMSELPVYLELDGLQVIHSTWSREYLDQAAALGLLDDENRIVDDQWHAIGTKGTKAYEVMEILLKGPKLNLPPGYSYMDSDGHERTRGRMAWWMDADDSKLTLADLLVEPVSGLPDLPIPEEVRHQLRRMSSEGMPTAFGHYWMRGVEPQLLADGSICVDRSVAKEGHLLAATMVVESQEIIRDYLLSHVQAESARAKIDPALLAGWTPVG